MQSISFQYVKRFLNSRNNNLSNMQIVKPSHPSYTINISPLDRTDSQCPLVHTFLKTFSRSIIRTSNTQEPIRCLQNMEQYSCSRGSCSAVKKFVNLIGVCSQSCRIQEHIRFTKFTVIAKLLPLLNAANYSNIPYR